MTIPQIPRSLSGVMAIAIAFFTISSSLANEASDPHDVFGLWRTQAGSSHVEIAACENSAPCGRIVWIDDPDADALKDTENPDPSLQDAPLLGLTILSGFERKKNAWKNGRIYDPEAGKSYRSVLRRNEDGDLEMKGCVGPICRKQIWTLIEE